MMQWVNSKTKMDGESSEWPSMAVVDIERRRRWSEQWSVGGVYMPDQDVGLTRVRLFPATSEDSPYLHLD